MISLLPCARVPGWGSSPERSKPSEGAAREGGLSQGSWELRIAETCWVREWTWLKINPCILFLDGSQLMS